MPIINIPAMIRVTEPSIVLPHFLPVPVRAEPPHSRLLPQLIGNAPVCFLTRAVVIHAKKHLINVPDVLYALKKHKVRDGTGCRVAVLLPVIPVHGDEGQHIYRRFKQENLTADAVPMETESGIAAVHIALEAALTA